MTPPVSDSVLARLRSLSTPTIVDQLSRRGYIGMVLEGVRSLIPGQRLAGRAVTLRFVPTRADLRRDAGPRETTAEYRAMELCGPGDMLVVDAMRRPYAPVGGDIKFISLKVRGAEGIVTDGALRDVEVLKGFGLRLFAANPSPKSGSQEMLPWGVNEVIQCGGTAVRPGDVLVGDDDGVVVIPGDLAAEIAADAEEYERVEQFVKELIEQEKCSPGRYFPFTDEVYRLYKQRSELAPSPPAFGHPLSRKMGAGARSEGQ